jgi:hypothetical protein
MQAKPLSIMSKRFGGIMEVCLVELWKSILKTFKKSITRAKYNRSYIYTIPNACCNICKIEVDFLLSV